MISGKKVIGITGGIGAGKTMVLNLLEKHFNAYIIEADRIGHKVMEYGTKGYEMVVKAFGEDIVACNKAENNYIDRKVLGSIVFDDKSKLELLNSITHPLIYEYILDLINSSQSELIVVEAAILTETTLKDLCDTIWYVYAKKDVRLKRLEEYRSITEEKALQVMANQPDEEEFKSKCDVTIDNSFDKENTLLQIKEILLGGNLWAK